MLTREIWGKSTSLIFRNFEISLFSLGRFQNFKSELGKFIPNFPLKHVITSSNISVISLSFFIKGKRLYKFNKSFLDEFFIQYFSGE